MTLPPQCPTCKTSTDYSCNRRVQGVGLKAFECVICECCVLVPDNNREAELLSEMDRVAKKRVEPTGTEYKA